MSTELAAVNSRDLATVEELSKFVLIGREKLVAVRAEIRAIDKVGLAKEVREQKLAEAQDIAEAVLDAEVRIGQLMSQVPKASKGQGTNQYTKNAEIDSGVEFSKPKQVKVEPSVFIDEVVEDDSDDWNFEEEPVEPEPQQKTKAEVVKEAGFSQKQVERFQTLAAHTDLVEKAKEEARNNDDIVSRSLVLNMVKEQKRAEKEEKREEQRQENAEKIGELSTPLEAQGLFQTIVIDPPWDWGDWVTNRSLPKAFRLIETWGFRYITCLTWVKPSFGMGNYFRGSTEQILFAVKGSQPLKRKDVGTHFEAPRGNGHSAKPDEFYNLVESCSYGPYIDIFGRKERDGWSVWGENG